MSNISDRMLLEAIREKALNDIKAQHAAQQIFNITGQSGTGAGSPASGVSGVGAAMSGPDTMSQEDRDYYVDILREDMPEINEATGKPKGWKKQVHRYTTPKGEEPKKGPKR